MHRLRLALLTAVAVVLAVALVQATRALDAEVVATSGPATQQVTTAAPITDGPPLTLRLMTYNLLGSHHTEPLP